MGDEGRIMGGNGWRDDDSDDDDGGKKVTFLEVEKFFDSLMMGSLAGDVLPFSPLNKGWCCWNFIRNYLTGKFCGSQV